MMKSFEQMFKVTKTQIQCFLNGGVTIGSGSFYGLLFEPYFHSRIKEQGYAGRFRVLEAPDTAEGGDAKPNKNKRTVWGLMKTSSKVITIPIMQYNVFYNLREIVQGAYNVPSRKDFAAIDSLAPSRGELYQITSAESHPVKLNHLMKLKPQFNDFIKRTGKKSSLSL